MFELVVFSTVLLTMTGVMLSGLLSSDLIALLGLGALLLFGFLTPSQAFQGFSSPTVITMLGTFVVTSGMKRTGIAERAGEYLFRVAGKGEVRVIFVVVTAAAFLSSFVNNLAATVLLLPAVATLATLSGVPSSLLFLPLSFGTLLGGMITLIGTTPNILASELLVARGERPFTFFEFMPFGVTFSLAGALYLSLFGRKFLPRHGLSSLESRKRSLQKQYKLTERLFSLRVPEFSKMEGKTLRELRIGEILGAQVIEIIRGELRIGAVGASEAIYGRDVLVVRGRPFEIEALLRFAKSGVRKVTQSHLRDLEESVGSARMELLTLSPSLRTLKDLDLSNRFGVLIAGIERNGNVDFSLQASTQLSRGAVLHLVGPSVLLEKMQVSTSWSVSREDFLYLQSSTDELYEIHVGEESSLKGLSLRETRLGRLAHALVFALRREGAIVIPTPDTVLREGDLLFLRAKCDKVDALTTLGALTIESLNIETTFESADWSSTEVVLSPHSGLIGSSLAEYNFTEKFQVQVLAIWRGGVPKRARLSHERLQFGDMLLLRGERGRLGTVLQDKEFVPLQPVSFPHRTNKIHWSLISLVAMIGLAILNVVPLEVAAFLSGLLVLITRTVTMEEAYRDIEWRVIAVVAALIPFGAAFDKSGLFSTVELFFSAASRLGGAPSIVVLLAIIASTLSLFLDNTIAVLVLIPIALSVSRTYGIDAHALAMVVTLSASIVFVTPFGHRANLMVMAAGPYKAKDFAVVGGHLTLIIFVLMAIILPLIYSVKTAVPLH
jgi:di/tricarboxylate transporter